MRTYLIWNELLVPRWSRSWHKQPITRARHSISPKTFKWKNKLEIENCCLRVLSSYLPPLCRCQDGKHHLSDIKSMTPIVISNVSVILLHAQQPPTKHLIVDMKAFDQVQVEEHPETSLKCAIIVQIQVIKMEIVKLKVRWWRYFETLLMKASVKGKCVASHHHKSDSKTHH